MNFLRTFEDHVAGIFGAARAPFSFKKLAKQTAREIEDQTLVINGQDTAPALITVLIAADDDQMMAPLYPQLTREIRAFVKAHASKKRYALVGEPLVRFMIDPALKAGRFSVFAENVDAPTLGRLYEEERAYLQGLGQNMAEPAVAPAPAPAPAAESRPHPTPRQDSPRRAGSGIANVPAVDVAADPFDMLPDTPAPAPIPVPRTITREQIAGVGGAAATGAALGAGTSIAQNMASSRPQVTAPPLAQLVDVVTGDVYEVTGSSCTVGRERATSDVTLRDPNVSRRHAQLTFNGQDWTIEDLGSTNGTLVNNRRVNRCPLRSGDLLTFGLSTFEFRS